MLTRRRILKGGSASLCAAAIPCLIPAAADAAVTLPAEFRSRLARAKLRLDLAALHDFDTVRMLPNPHFDYDIRVRHTGSDFEIRYAIRTLSSGDSPDPTFADVTVLNISRSIDGKPARGDLVSDPEMARQAFGADWAARVLFQPRPTFAKQPNGNAIVIYRRSPQAFVVMLYLYTEPPAGPMMDAFLRVYQRSLFALRFE